MVIRKYGILPALILLTALSALFSCNNNNKISLTGGPEFVVPNLETAPLSAYIDFETNRQYDSVSLQIEGLNHLTDLRYSHNEKAPNGYLLMLMKPGVEHTIRLKLKNENGNWSGVLSEVRYTPPKLPDDDKLFPKIEISKNENGSGQQLTLFNPRRRVPRTVENENEFNASFGMLTIVNNHGEVLWYYQTDSRISDFNLLPNGHISYITQDFRIVEIDFGGHVINEWVASERPQGPDSTAIPVKTPTFHHDVELLPNGNQLVLSTEIRKFDNYYTSERDEDAPRKTQEVAGDVIVEFTPEGKIVHQWHAFDHLPARRIGYETFSNYWVRRGFDAIDWSHANAIVPLPDENACLVNFRYQSAMVKVNKQNGEIVWIFAEPSGWGEELNDKLLKIPESGWNWHQHSPSFTSEGNLLFFNNNNYKARPFDEPAAIEESPSYAVEYKIDEENRTVEKVWSTLDGEGENVYSIAMGRVSELKESGNILVCYGALLSSEYFDEMTWWNRADYPQWTMVREYTHTEPAEIVWEMRLQPLFEDSNISWTLFGAERLNFDNIDYNHLRNTQAD